MSEQENPALPLSDHPVVNNPKASNAHWKAQGQEWRTDPEIDETRKIELAQRRNTIKPDIQKSIYPFNNMKLRRADVEWLLATYANGKETVDRNDESQQIFEGLDLRGADLSHEDLSDLPLARMRGGLDWNEKRDATDEQCEKAAIHLEEAILRYAHLEGAILRYAHLEGAILKYAHLEGTYLRYAHLEDTNLRGAFLDSTTDLRNVFFSNEKHRGPLLAGIHWGEVDLTLVDWSGVKLLGDESEARQRKGRARDKEEKEQRLSDYRNAVRAYQQLAVALQTQGQNEHAAHFAYRAQVLQRVILLLQRKLVAYIFSWLLALLTGYGHKPERTLYWYSGVIVSFAIIYYVLGIIVGSHLVWYEALLFSLKEFHGRGFFADQAGSMGIQTTAAAIEAFFGLFVEAGLIAAFTQRFFGK